MILRASRRVRGRRVSQDAGLWVVLFVRDLTNTRRAAFDLPDRVGLRPFSSAVPGDRPKTICGRSNPPRLRRRIRPSLDDQLARPLMTANREDYGGDADPV